MDVSLPVLTATNLSCQKQDRCLFSALDLSVETGELVHLTGPNGAGKTSLLRILVGLSQPDTGQVILTSDNRLPVLYLGHKLALNKHLTAIENLTFWLQLHQPYLTSTLANLLTCSTSMSDYLYQILARFSLVGLEDVSVGHLSAGQQRRVSLARTQLVEAALWVLDEPYTSLDVAGVAFIQAQVDAFVERGGAVLMTSHQPLQSRLKVRNVVLEYQL